MNREEFFEKVKDNTWYAKKFGWQNIRMGESSFGILAIIFEENGQITYPNKLEFYPNISKWTFNKEKQKIDLLNSNNEVQSTLSLPFEDGLKVAMKEENSLNLFISYNQLYTSMNFLYAPDPLTNLSYETSVNDQILTMFPSTLIADKSDNLFGINIRIEEQFRSFSFWSKCYDFIINNPKVNPIAIFNDDYIIVDNWFSKIVSNQLSVLSKDNKFSGIIAERYMMVEFLGELNFMNTISKINDKNNNVYDNVDALLSKYSQDRMKLVSK